MKSLELAPYGTENSGEQWQVDLMVPTENIQDIHTKCLGYTTRIYNCLRLFFPMICTLIGIENRKVRKQAQSLLSLELIF